MKVSRLKKGGVVAAACTAIIISFEGMRTVAYKDVVGVWTVCAGETQGVVAGDRYTLAQCKYKLTTRLEDYAIPIESCLPNLPDGRFIAFVSLAWNIGAQRACQSTAARLMRLGKWREGCAAFMQWNKAGGIVWPGLTKRRLAERDMCLKGTL